jgi:hypothetical protein
MRTGRGDSIAPRALAAPPRLRRYGFGFSSAADSLHASLVTAARSCIRVGDAAAAAELFAKATVCRQ